MSKAYAAKYDRTEERVIVYEYPYHPCDNLERDLPGWFLPEEDTLPPRLYATPERALVALLLEQENRVARIKRTLIMEQHIAGAIRRKLKKQKEETDAEL